MNQLCQLYWVCWGSFNWFKNCQYNVIANTECWPFIFESQIILNGDPCIRIIEFLTVLGVVYFVELHFLVLLSGSNMWDARCVPTNQSKTIWLTSRGKKVPNYGLPKNYNKEREFYLFSCSLSSLSLSLSLPCSWEVFINFQPSLVFLTKACILEYPNLIISLIDSEPLNWVVLVEFLESGLDKDHFIEIK